jgi:signal transduction histidine kinase
VTVDAALVAHVQNRSEAERAWLAHELHTEVSGLLTAARMDVSWLKAHAGKNPAVREHLERLDGAVDRANHAARQLMQRLRPALLDHFGLPVALRHHVEETCRAAGASCRIVVDDSLEGVDAQLQIAAYRVVEELLGNAEGIAEIAATLQPCRDGYRMEIELRRVTNPSAAAADDAHGDHRCVGLAALQAWLEVLGGSWSEKRDGPVDVTTLHLPRQK